MSGPIGFSRYVSVVCKCPGVGGTGRNYVSVAIGRADGKRTCRADSFRNRLNKWFRIYLNTDLEGLPDTIARDTRLRCYGIDDGLNGIGSIDKRLTDGILWCSYCSFSSDIVVCSHGPGVGRSCWNNV